MLEKNLGHSFGIENRLGHTRVEILTWLLELSNGVIELNFGPLDRLNQGLTQEEIELICQFKYVSLHAPVKNETNHPLVYPSDETQKAVSQIQQLMTVIPIQTVLFHPDIVDDFDWLISEFGDKLAFENMDRDKATGNTLESLVQVFDQASDARWVCDVNHIYTMDPTMALAKQMHQAFGDRLCHYHLSACAGGHNAFIDHPAETIILEGVQKSQLPLVHEGCVTTQDEAYLIAEHNFVLTQLKIPLD